MKYIKLTKNQFSIVDNEDYERLIIYSWHAQKDKNTYYARTNTSKKLGTSQTVRMHHFIIGFPLKGMKVDHINGNGLDNRKENLRIITSRENSQNNFSKRQNKATSIYPGVYWFKLRKKWRASFQCNGKSKHLGLFDSEEEASYKYEEAVIEHEKMP